ncbi:MAG: hypothetical protein IJI66_08240 [Erysipelotrichaceae bacterium]|nr:hypothetical protein [Erysipelotrichaceae bacterium]
MKTKELGLYTKRDDYYVTATVQKTGQIYNHLEDCYYDLDEERCFVIEGTVGEKWPVNLEALEKTYQLDEKTKKKLFDGDSVKIHPKKTTAILLCFEALEEARVKTSYGDELTAHVGDIIGYRLDEEGNYKPSHGRVINKEVFKNTYIQVKSDDILD